MKLLNSEEQNEIKKFKASLFSVSICDKVSYHLSAHEFRDQVEHN